MNQPPSRSDKILNLLSFVFAIFGLVLFFIYITSQNHHFGTDWVTSFKPATLALIHGENIYLESYKFFNPPWIVFPLIPFAFLPDRIVSIFFCFYLL